MARVPVEDCLENVESRFQLVHLAVRRVLQLRSGAAPLVKAPKNKEVVVALREIAGGRISMDNIRQFDEVKEMAPLPQTPALETDDTVRTELKEILESATQFDASLEYEESARLDDEELGPEAGEDED
jgi:DNA-directed RNA polymerase subunit omega